MKTVFNIFMYAALIVGAACSEEDPRPINSVKYQFSQVDPSGLVTPLATFRISETSNNTDLILEPGQTWPRITFEGQFMSNESVAIQGNIDFGTVTVMVGLDGFGLPVYEVQDVLVEDLELLVERVTISGLQEVAVISQSSPGSRTFAFEYVDSNILD